MEKNKKPEKIILIKRRGAEALRIVEDTPKVTVEKLSTDDSFWN